MGVRDRLRLLVGRGRVEPSRPEPVGRAAGPDPVAAVSPPTARVPRRFSAADLAGAARIVDLRGGAAVPSDLLSPAARVAGPVIVRCEDGVRSAGVAERLCAHGIDAGWVAEGAP